MKVFLPACHFAILISTGVLSDASKSLIRSRAPPKRHRNDTEAGTLLESEKNDTTAQGQPSGYINDRGIYVSHRAEVHNPEQTSPTPHDSEGHRDLDEWGINDPEEDEVPDAAHTHKPSFMNRGADEYHEEPDLDDLRPRPKKRSSSFVQTGEASAEHMEAETEAYLESQLDESFIWWDRRRRRRRYDCKWLAWDAWQECTVPCGAGMKQRNRIPDGPHWGGAVCTGDKSQFETCNLQGCEVDCNWAHWGNWGPCSKTCGFGLQVRQRGILPYTEIDGGKDCPDEGRKSSQECSRFHCPVPCYYAQWTLWGGCSLTCGAGLKRRTRAINGPYHGGDPCDDLIGPTHEEKCNNFECPINCGWGSWSSYGPCSRTCGGGIRLRERTILYQMENGGAHCPGSPAEVTACNLQECPVNCKWAPWHDPAPCTKTCGGGMFLRHRAKITLQAYNGVPCYGPNTEIGPCNVEPCAVDCQYADWEPWGECSASCGGGIHEASRNGTDPFHGGAECSQGNMTKEGECNTHPCDGKMAAYQQAYLHTLALLPVVALSCW